MTQASRDPRDPKNLIADCYAIDGIVVEECRSIFFDWALTLPAGESAADAAAHFLTKYEPDYPDHPMTGVLKEALVQLPQSRRRGGRAARVPDAS